MGDEKALFTVHGPNLTIGEVTVGREGFQVGRTADNDLQLDHGEISRRHMRIFWEDDVCWVEDLHSSNGVWVNDARIYPNTPQRLKRGDVIRCGPFFFTFARLVLPPPPELAAVTPEQEPPPSPPPSPPPPAAPMIPPSGPSLPVKAQTNGYPPGIPQDKSNWLQYLPGIYSEDDFVGRYLLVFESIMSPIIWMIDNFDLYLSTETAPQEWLQWMAGWFDLLLLPDLSLERQRAVMRQLGWLFFRRGTRVGLERILELYFDVRPEIIESRRDPGHFVVRLPLSESSVKLGRDVADRLIASQKPAFAAYTLEIT